MGRKWREQLKYKSRIANSFLTDRLKKALPFQHGKIT
jgi:hypothetical protein